MAVPIDSLINSESSDEDFSDSEFSYSSEDESMEDESSETINGRGSLSSFENEETEPNEDEFWVRYPYLKKFLDAIVAQGMIPGYFVSERSKHIEDDKAKEMNEKCKALSIMELELCSMKYGLIASTISAMKPGT